jgi:hypothetical protein
MDAEILVSKWRQNRRDNADVMPEPIASVRQDNERAQALVAQMKQLVEYSPEVVNE